MPWEKIDKTKERKPNGRLAFVFQIAREDSPRLVALLDEAKVKNLWGDIFGEAAFTVQMIPTKQSGEDPSLAGKRAPYVEMVQTHGSVQLSMGAASINGLINFTKKFVLCRTNEDGSPATAIKKSVQNIMRYKTLNGDKVWLSAIPKACGGVTGYFSCVLPGIKKYIEHWTLCPAAQIFWFLLRKDCNKEDVKKMIQGSFSIDEQRKVTRSRYSKSLGFAVVDNGSGMDITNVAKLFKAYDTDLGLSDKEKREKLPRTGGCVKNRILDTSVPNFVQKQMHKF